MHLLPLLFRWTWQMLRSRAKPRLHLPAFPINPRVLFRRNQRPTSKQPQSPVSGQCVKKPLWPFPIILATTKSKGMAATVKTVKGQIRSGFPHDFHTISTADFHSGFPQGSSRDLQERKNGQKVISGLLELFWDSVFFALFFPMRIPNGFKINARTRTRRIESFCQI